MTRLNALVSGMGWYVLRESAEKVVIAPARVLHAFSADTPNFVELSADCVEIFHADSTFIETLYSKVPVSLETQLIDWVQENRTQWGATQMYAAIAA